MKKLISALTAVILIASLLAGCSSDSGTSSTNTPPRETQQTSYSTTINIYMPMEYVDVSVLRDFEKEFDVGVNLVEFESNEQMYDEIIKSSQYDVLVPSDYMIDRLIQEGHLAKLDHAKLPNMSYVAQQYLGPAYDRDNDYHVPYMVGTLGILYNRKTLQIATWQDMFNASGILMVDSERDVVGLTLKMLGYSMNSTDDSELEAAKQALRGAKSNIRGFYDSAYVLDMVAAQEAFVGVVYSGDGKLAVDLNPSLAYVVPEEGSNKWTDSFVVPINSTHIDLAHEFINFMCRPQVAIRNMSEIGYTSPIQDSWSEFAGNKIMFPSDEELARCEVFAHSSQIAEKHSRVYNDIK